MPFEDLVQAPDTRANQPAANSVPIGTLYCVTDEDDIVERSNGTTWDAYSPAAGGAGTVTNTGTLTADAVIVGNGTVDVKALASLGTAGQVLTSNGAGTPPSFQAASGGGAIVQVVNTQTGAVASGSTTIPFDDTIPQNTEGVEYMTLAITPTDAANKLKIEVAVACTGSSEAWLLAALFQDSTASALAAAWMYMTIATSGQTINFTHYMTAGTTSATTFKVRAGTSNGGVTFTFNGQSTARIFGGVAASSITITEIVP